MRSHFPRALVSRIASLANTNKGDSSLDLLVIGLGNPGREHERDGHNGLRSLAQSLGTQDFLRLRIGVGRPARGDPRSVADYVLAPFELEEDVGALVARAAEAVETVAREGVEATQQRFN